MITFSNSYNISNELFEIRIDKFPSQKNVFSNIPKDLILQIFEFLNFKDMIKTLLTSKVIYKTLKSPNENILNFKNFFKGNFYKASNVENLKICFFTKDYIAFHSPNEGKLYYKNKSNFEENINVFDLNGCDKMLLGKSSKVDYAMFYNSITAEVIQISKNIGKKSSEISYLINNLFFIPKIFETIDYKNGCILIAENEYIIYFDVLNTKVKQFKWAANKQSTLSAKCVGDSLYIKCKAEGNEIETLLIELDLINYKSKQVGSFPWMEIAARKDYFYLGNYKGIFAYFKNTVKYSVTMQKLRVIVNKEINLNKSFSKVNKKCCLDKIKKLTPTKHGLIIDFESFTTRSQIMLLWNPENKKNYGIEHLFMITNNTTAYSTAYSSDFFYVTYSDHLDIYYIPAKFAKITTYYFPNYFSTIPKCLPNRFSFKDGKLLLAIDKEIFVIDQLNIKKNRNILIMPKIKKIEILFSNLYHFNLIK